MLDLLGSQLESFVCEYAFSRKNGVRVQLLDKRVFSSGLAAFQFHLDTISAMVESLPRFSSAQDS